LCDLRPPRDNHAVGEPSAEAGSRSWWQTLPGMLTAAAALISAVTGLVVAVQQLRGSDHSSSSASPSAGEAGSATTADRPTASSGGTRAPATGTARASKVTFPLGRSVRIGDASYRVLTATARAVNPGELMLGLRVRIVNNGQYDANFWSRTFRLRVGSDTSTPTNFLDEVVAAGTTDIGNVDFSVRATVRRATLLVGDDPSKAIALPVRLTPRR
jgi:hypothetical protein